MKTKLYPRLALLGVRKNARLYIPYFISCIGSVMMYYIIDFLGQSGTVKEISGGGNLSMVLSMGKFVIAVFSLIFLFYTNSFLIRRRNKEFGLYNILGMDKKGISKIICFESLMVCVVSIAAGLFFGVILSKLAELGLLYIIKAQVSYKFSVEPSSIKYTLVLYAAIFAVLLLRSLFEVGKKDALDLMKSENYGEKPPKANFIFAVLGAVILIAAYLIAVLTKSPLSAISNFLIAVIMVIVATYLLFIAGSVTLCKVLQKNKNYYYKKNHFVSVSSMAYRMKRNGAGLASICILSTMVLVMIASSASLYFGAGDSMKARFPMENQIVTFPPSIDYLDEKYMSQLEEHYGSVFEEEGVKPSKTRSFRYAYIAGLLENGVIEPDVERVVNRVVVMDDIRQLYFMNVNDYNKIMGTDIKIEKGQVMTATIRCSFKDDTLRIGDVNLKVVGSLDKYPNIGTANVAVASSIIAVISDFSDIEPLDSLVDFNGSRMLDTCLYYGYNLDESEEKTIEVIQAQRNAIGQIDFIHNEDGGYTYELDCLDEQRADFYTTFGGLFFIGIILSIIFIFAMAMIIYYKQISEGYEDKSRFEIMQKIRITKKDISKSVNSQTLTVFFAPLIMAGIHLCFAFPPIWKILMLFNMTNLSFVILVTAAAFVFFGVFYIVLYKITSNAYFSIVSSTKE